MKFLKDKHGYFTPTFIPFLTALIIGIGIGLYILFPDAWLPILIGTAGAFVATNLMLLLGIRGVNNE